SSLHDLLTIQPFFFFKAEDGIRDRNVTGVQTCALPISFFNTLLQKPLKAQRTCHWVRVGSICSPPFATAKAGDDFPLHSPQQAFFLNAKNRSNIFEKKILLNAKKPN